MSGDYYNMNIQGVSDERRAQVEAEALPVIMDLLGDKPEYYYSGKPTLDDVFEGEMKIDHAAFAELTKRWPDAIFRLGWDGADEGGWPCVVWIKNGNQIKYWDSREAVPDECPGLDDQALALDPESEDRNDYTLNEGYTGVWVKVGDVAIYIRREGDSVFCAAHPAGDEMRETLASFEVPGGAS